LSKGIIQNLLFRKEKMKEYYITNKPVNVGNLENLKKESIERNRKYYRNLQESNFYCVTVLFTPSPKLSHIC
jgi:hypothetical protein